jgi:hypothetical protein
MHTHPDLIGFVRENVDVMIPTAHRSELGRRGLLQLAQRRKFPGGIVEELVVDARSARLPDSERDVAHDFVHDLLHCRRDLRPGRIGPNGEIATGDVEPHAGEGNFVRISDDPADRLRVAFVTIRAKDSALPSRFHAAIDLRHRGLVVFAKDFRFHPASF